jgi:AraC-like DNA-binding protein
VCDRSVEDVALRNILKVGFSDQSHLTRLFKRRFDITPQRYRKG